METAEEIVALLKAASAAYYNSGKTIMSDKEYDELNDKLAKIAPKHPYLKEVGAPAGEAILPYWMGSLDKIRDDSSAISRFSKKYPDNGYVIADKLDGISALYANNKLYTRGNGHTGQDITHLAKYLNLFQGPDVRGEIIISKKNWTNIKDGANARNVVAGVVNAKKPNANIIKYIEFVAYENLSSKTIYSDGLSDLKKIGYNIVNFQMIDKLDVKNLQEIIMNRKNASNYEIDGIVITHNKYHKRIDGENPKHSFAFKTAAAHEEAEAIVADVSWNVSKDGLLKPIVVFKDPIQLDGVEIRKSSGYNARYIRDNKIGPGAKVVIIRSGGVIPKIERIITPAPKGPALPPADSFKWNEAGIEAISIQLEQSNRRIKEIEYFVSTVGIKGIGPSLIQRVYEHGIDSVFKLFAITKKQLLTMPGFEVRSADNFITAIRSVDLNKIDLDKLMAATNSFGAGLGSKKLKLIIETFPGIYNGEIPNKSELMSIKGIGSTTADGFIDGAHKFYKFIGELGIKPTAADAPEAAPAQAVPAEAEWMKDKTFVFTGFRNKDAEKLIVASGGIVSGTVNKKTDYLIASDPSKDTGSIKKAREYDITILSREEFESKSKI